MSRVVRAVVVKAVALAAVFPVQTIVQQVSRVLRLHASFPAFQYLNVLPETRHFRDMLDSRIYAAYAL